MVQQIDLLVLGGGPGGYSAAIRASQLGKKVVVAEKSSLGGTCLNRGCIPTKALLESAHFYGDLANAKKHGVSIDINNLNYEQVIDNKDNIVTRLVKGLQFLLKKREIKIVEGEARFNSEQEIQIGEEVFQPTHIIVATGTEPMVLPGLEPDGKLVLNSDQLLDAKTLPESLVIVGGGVIGCEFATIFASYGVKVTIVELTEQILPPEDKEIARTLTREFKKRKINVLTNAAVKKLTEDDGRVLVEVHQGDNITEITTDRVLISVGRQAIVPEGFSGEIDSRGYIKVNHAFQTNVSHIYAVGDVIGGMQLAHLAFEEGWAAVNNIYGEKARNEWFVPSCVYTQPEIGSVGLTEEQVRKKYGEAIIAKYSLKGNGKAVIVGLDSGFCKLIASSDGIVRGAHIIGPQATELISGVTVALEQGLTLEKWAEIIYPHPTVSEAIKEAILNGLGTGLHSL